MSERSDATDRLRDRLDALPDVGALCAEGERAFTLDEFEKAAAWYELACAGTVRETDYCEDLVARRFERCAELRRMLRWRGVQRRALPDPGHLVGVMTCKGRERSFQRTWFGGVEDWKKRNDHRAFAVHDWEARGEAQTLFSAFRVAADHPGMTAFTLLEDDVVLMKNALDYIATTRIDDDLAFISWFSVETCEVPRVRPTLVCYPALGYMFNQAITFPARTVYELLESKALKEWNEPHGADRLYEKVFPDRLIAVHYPNLVQHVGGQESLTGNNSHGLRTSPTFPGEGFDALTLVR